MPEQLDINGNVQPVSWDGEPLFSPATVAEGLFDGRAFEQMRGQTSMCGICGAGHNPANSWCGEQR